MYTSTFLYFFNEGVLFDVFDVFPKKQLQFERVLRCMNCKKVGGGGGGGGGGGEGGLPSGLLVNFSIKVTGYSLLINYS